MQSIDDHAPDLWVDTAIADNFAELFTESVDIPCDQSHFSILGVSAILVVSVHWQITRLGPLYLEGDMLSTDSLQFWEKSHWDFNV